MTVQKNKDFGSPVSNTGPKKKDDVVFDLYEETFSCYPQIQGRDLMLFSKGATSDDNGEVVDALLGFFEKALYPESFERMEALWNDPEKIIPMETLTDIVAWVSEQYAENPTE